MIVVWRITQHCNLSCPFCAYDRTTFRRRKDADPAVVRRFGTVLFAYQHATKDSVLVSWIGGEPFLFPYLARLTVFFASELKLRVSATTNGTTLGSAKIRDHILAHYSELTISVDGIGPVHDNLRSWPGGFSTLREGVTYLAEAKRQNGRGPRLRANVVLMRQTLVDFEPLCVELANWGIEEITFNQLGGRDRPEFFPEHRLSSENAAWLAAEIPPLRARLAKLGVRLNGSDNYLRRIRASSRDEFIPVTDCRPGERFLFINENGIAAPCNFTTRNYGIPVEELDGPPALLELPKRFGQLRTENGLAACEDCHSTQVFEKFAA
ncbi:MAG TPA: radical SAM protein [Verrucomicrobiae bacterium]|jgi:MoaA/NifB/PqqE/SkfB family radical SAM enzyme